MRSRAGIMRQTDIVLAEMEMDTSILHAYISCPPEKIATSVYVEEIDLHQ